MTLVLLTVLAALVAGASAVSAQGAVPDAPDRPVGTAVFVGGVDLEWNDVPGADSYGVQMYRNGQWTDLPGDGIEIAFYGAGAIISELEPEGSSYWFRVRARSVHGFSEWSDFNFMASTNESKSGRRARPDNVPASGTPVISGTAQVGETLTADTTDVEDGNGLDRVQFRFQWVSHDGGADTDIASETDSTYTLAASDEGKTIRVRVAFTDRDGYSESLTGGETATVAARPNSPATGAPAVTGTAQVGETLAADTSGIGDTDGLTKVSYSYLWIANDGTADTDITDATDSTYALMADDAGNTIKVRVSFTDDAGNDESLTSAATEAVDARPNSPATGQPTQVAPQSGSDPDAYVTVVITSSDDTVSWSDPDECTSDYNTYLSVTSGPGTGTTSRTHIGSVASGSTEATQTISLNWTGNSLNPPRVKAELYCGTFDASSSQNVLIASTGLATQLYLAPQFTGLREGTYSSAPLTALTISSGTLSPTFDRGINTYTAEVPNDVEVITLDPTVLTGYQTDFVRNPGWGVVSACGWGCNYSYGNGATTGIVLADADEETEGFQINLNRGENRLGIGVNTGNVYAGPGRLYLLAVTVANSPATGQPTISGTAEMGETLTADTSGIVDIDGLDNVSFSYQWIRSDGAADLNNTAAPFHWNPTDGTADLDIDGATSATYTVTVTDVDKAIKLRVDFTDDKGSIESLTSSATVVVPVVAAFTFSIDGTTVTCDSYNVHIVNLPKKECDDPSSIDQGASEEIEVEIEIARSVNSQLYKFDFHIYQMEDSLGNYRTVEANDLCLGPGLAESASIEITPNDGTGPFTYTDDGTIFELCPAGTFQLYVPWYRYNYTDQEYEYAGTFRRYFFITSDDEVDASIEKVKWITALYPDPPASHDDVQIEATKESEVLNRDLATFSLSIGGLVPDSDAETTDYVVRLKVIGDDGPYKEVPWCHVGNVGYSYLLKTVPEDGRWAMDAHVLGNCLLGSWPDTLQVELFNGAYEFIAGKDIALGALPNSAATGAPTISDTAQVGETLTADTAGIADDDGLDNVSYSYQWLADDADIAGATATTYTLADADEGKAIKVRVSFTDDAGFNETLTSAATEAVSFAVQQQVANSPATGAPTISGTAQVGETLTADITSIADDDGLDNVSYSYQWIANDGGTDADISGETDATYTLVADDVGKTIKVRVSFTDDAGTGETLTSMPTAVVAAPAQVDSENEPSELSHLTVVVTEDDSDPDDVVSTFTITWNDAEDCSSSYNAYLDGVVGEPIHLGSAASEGEQIAGSLTNVSAEAFGFNVKLHCGTIGSDRLVDRLWIPEYSRSFGTLPISRAYLPKPGTYSTEPGLIALTVSSGTLTPAFHNQTLNYTVPDVPNADGRFTLTTTAKADYYTVAFLPGSYHTFFSVCSHGGQQTSLFYGDDAGNQIYPLTDADANTPGFQMDLDEGENVFYIRVWPNCQTGQLYKLTVTRAANAPANTPATGAPTIGGTARVGQTLTADTTGIADSDGLENATFAYQWLADDTDIADATDSTYTLVAAAEGKTIKVRVSFTDDADNDETLTSAATGEVEALPNRPATGAPTISGTAQVWEALTADTSGIADDDGLNNVSYSYQWIRNDGSSDTDITDATGSTYHLAADDEGQTIKVKVTFTDDADNEETLTSDATAEVAAAAPTEPPGRPRNLTGTANSDGTVTLSWDAPNDDSVTGYQILRRRPREGESTLLVHVNDTGSTAAEYTDNDVTPDVVHAYRVKAINAVGLSRQSNFVSITPTQPAEPAQNTSATGLPTIGGTAQVGETLTADTSGIADADGLTNVSYSYQWIPNDGNSDTDNQDAPGSTYTLVDADEGKTIKVEVSFTDDAGNGESLTSAATAEVAARPNTPATGTPTISGTAQVGEMLTADTSGIADADRLTNVSYSYQWIANDGTAATDITGATDSTYTLVSADEGKTIKVRVSFTDDAGTTARR